GCEELAVRHLVAARRNVREVVATNERAAGGRRRPARIVDVPGAADGDVEPVLRIDDESPTRVPTRCNAAHDRLGIARGRALPRLVRPTVNGGRRRGIE